MSHIWTGPPPTVTEPLIKGTSTNPFCGPAALALILNQPLDYVDQLLTEKLGTSIQRGLFYPDIFPILEKSKCRFKAAGRRVILLRDKGIYLIFYKGHCGVLKDKIYYDNSFPEGNLTIPSKRIEKVFQIWRP